MLQSHPLSHRLVVIDTSPALFNYIGFQRQTEGRLAGKLTHLSTDLDNAVALKDEILHKGGVAHLEFPGKMYAECTYRCTTLHGPGEAGHTEQCQRRRHVWKKRVT